MFKLSKVTGYFREAYEEFRKVTWPTKSQTINYSLLVIFISLFLALFIGLVDYGLSLGVEKLITTQATDSTVPAQPLQDTTQPTTQTVPIQAGSVQATDSNGQPINVQVTPPTPTK